MDEVLEKETKKEEKAHKNANGDLICPRCGVKMLFDPNRSEYYCPKCGYTEPAYVMYGPPPSEEDVGRVPMDTYSIPKKNLGSYMTPDAVRKVLVKAKSGKRIVSNRHINLLLAEQDNRVFNKNLLDLRHVVSLLRKEGIRVSFDTLENVSKLVGKLLKRHEKDKERHYNTFYIFLAVLYHTLVYQNLSRHKQEILNAIVRATEPVVTAEKPSEIKKNINRKYNQIKDSLPNYGATMYDKIRAVSGRYRVPHHLVNDLFENHIDDVLYKGRSPDSIVFALVYFTADKILCKPITEGRLHISGIDYIYKILEEVVTEEEIISLREKYGVANCPPVEGRR